MFWSETPGAPTHPTAQYAYIDTGTVAAMLARLAPPTPELLAYPHEHGGCGCCGVSRALRWERRELTVPCEHGCSTHHGGQHRVAVEVCGWCTSMLDKHPGDDPDDLFARLMSGVTAHVARHGEVGSNGRAGTVTTRTSAGLAQVLDFRLYAAAGPKAKPPPDRRWAYLDLGKLRERAVAATQDAEAGR